MNSYKVTYSDGNLTIISHGLHASVGDNGNTIKVRKGINAKRVLPILESMIPLFSMLSVEIGINNGEEEK